MVQIHMVQIRKGEHIILERTELVSGKSRAKLLLLTFYK